MPRPTESIAKQRFGSISGAARPVGGVEMRVRDHRMSLLSRVAETLDAAGIRNALIGAVALVVYGVNRASVDID
jgi:hypothetical protein